MKTVEIDNNVTAVRVFFRELFSDDSFERKEIKTVCRCVVYTCFLMEIKPYQLPISKRFQGDLTVSQKREFMKQFVFLYMDCEGERFLRITRLLEKEPFWSHLLKKLDVLIDAGR